MKKLLTTTALIGLVASSVSSYAETKIKGSIEQTYNTISQGGTAASSGDAGLGQETNVKISSSKELDNGMTLSGHINMEDKGGSVQSDSTSIKLTSGAISFEVGVDTGQHIHSNINPRVDDNPFDSIGTIVGSDSLIRAQAHDKQHVGVAYKTDAGTLAVNYAPSDSGSEVSSSKTTDGGGSIMEISFKGNLGIDGLSVLAGQETAEADDSASTTAGQLEEKEQVLSVSYGQGPWAVGYTHRTLDDGDSASDTNGIENVTAISATYAISDTLSIGYENMTGEFESSAKLDEETDAITVGYNLGGLGVSFMYVESDNVAGGTTTAADKESFQIRTVYSF
ncbi:hypothetical protein N8847_00620 [Pelagibacteraceae bacterium]|nr:hypothetical protein [Pelagibacteraceae bacterium]